MTHKKFFLAVIILLLACSACYASDSLTFSGNMTLITSGRETRINGTKSIPMPKSFIVWTQDDHPSSMARIFKDEGHISENAALTVRTSEPFTVKSRALLEICVIQGSGDDAKLLSLGRKNRTLPPVTKDYYLAVDLPHETDPDVASLLYVKLSVEGSESESPSKYPAFAQCTGDNVRLRESPGTKSKVIGKLDNFESMTVYDEKRVKGEIWYLVEPVWYPAQPERKNWRGWIIGRYVNIE